MKYIRTGKNTDQKPTLVLQHGFLSGGEYWQSQIDFFSESFDVIAPTLPGFAANANSSICHSITGYCDYIIGILNHEGVDQFSMMGHSMGGMIAQEMSLMIPERMQKLILYATGPDGTMPGRFETIEASKERIMREGREETLKSTVASWFLTLEQDSHFPAALAMAESAEFDAMMAGYDAMQGWQSVDRLSQIKSDTLIIWGDQDRSYRWQHPEKLWNKIDGASLSVIAGCAHNMHLEKPDLFNQLVQDFLRK